MLELSQPPAQSTWAFDEGTEIRPGLTAIRLLGGGTRHEAYLATDDERLSPVVVKIVRPSKRNTPSVLEGLRGEKWALDALNHPVIVRSFGAELEGKLPHLVLEFIEGPRLSTLIRKYGPLPMEQLLPLALQLTSALHYMHERRIVHLDVKPRNIIMSAPPRLIDLSIARSLSEARTLTSPVGTDAYMAPEQCSPLRAGIVGPAADVWGLGATLYEAATGTRPFPRPDAGEREGPRFPQLLGSPDALPEIVPQPLADIINACLERDPRTRPFAWEVHEALEPLIAMLPTRPVLGRFRPRFR